MTSLLPSPSPSPSPSSSASILTAFTVALGVLCSAGSPCCGDTPIVEPRGTTTIPIAELAADGGITAESCNAACQRVQSDGYGHYECTRAAPVDAALDDGGEADDGGVRVACTWVTSTCSQPAGRRPRGHRDVRGRGTSELGAYFASIASLEAASVEAFEILARDLVAHGAPRRLIREARRAARDEVRHARAMAELARAHGGVVTLEPARGWRKRSLAAVARENAVEGCVRETFGALLATYQAQHAPTAELREAMSEIARDETRHAILAHDIHRWASKNLASTARANVRRAAQRARRTLTPPRPVPGAGLPELHAAKAMTKALHQALPL